MAGRSGAAAIEVALREAVASFDPRKLAAKFAAVGDTAAATALQELDGSTRSERVEDGERLLVYADESACAPTRKVDVSSMCDAVGYGAELLLGSKSSGDGQRVVSVSFYLE